MSAYGRVKSLRGLDRDQMQGVADAYRRFREHCCVEFDDGPFGEHPTKKPTVFGRADLFFHITPELHCALPVHAQEYLQKKTHDVLYQLHKQPQPGTEVAACASLVLLSCFGITDDAALRSYNTYLLRTQDKQGPKFKRNIAADENVGATIPIKPTKDTAMLLAETVVSVAPQFRSPDEKHAAIYFFNPLGIQGKTHDCAVLADSIETAVTRYIKWLDDRSAPKLIQNLSWISWFAAYNIASALHASIASELHPALEPGSDFMQRPEATVWAQNFTLDDRVRNDRKS